MGHAVYSDGLTKGQFKALVAIAAHERAFGHGPSIRALSAFLSKASTNSTQQILNRLAANGLAGMNPVRTTTEGRRVLGIGSSWVGIQNWVTGDWAHREDILWHSRPEIMTRDAAAWYLEAVRDHSKELRAAGAHDAADARVTYLRKAQIVDVEVRMPCLDQTAPVVGKG